MRQVCPLSLILFSLYISDLESQISCESTGFITILNQSISTLMFVDDLALFADSPAGLQHSLIILQQFCQQWKLNINAQKSKVLIFSKAKLKLQYRFYINQSEVEVVHSYKYLGLIITSNGSLKSSVSTLVNQAPKAMFVLLFFNDGSIEDEKHFMLSCTLYSNMPAYYSLLGYMQRDNP